MAHADGKKHGIGEYVIVALILAVITYVEYYIVEFPPAFMSSGWILFWLIAMSLVKFWMVIWFFMHLKDDDKLYTGFFSSGMVIGMGTFVALAFLFLLPRAVAPVVSGDAPAAEAHGAAYADALPDAVVANIESDGASRPLAERAGTPRPADLTLVVTPPPARADGFEVRLDDLTAAQTAVTSEVAADEPVAEAEPAAEPSTAEAVAEAPAAEAPAAEAAGAEEEAATPEPEPAADEVLAQAPADPTYDRDLGTQVYAANCAACHQLDGAGLPGVFPRLAGHAADLYQADGGRGYLIEVMLYGLQGQIAVGGTNYNGLMPAWAHLSDEQLAAVTNHIVAGFDGGAPDGFDAIGAEEVAARRGEGLTAAQVLESRGALGLE
jgi:mono/diheme cytochrome c family protein